MALGFLLDYGGLLAPTRLLRLREKTKTTLARSFLLVRSAAVLVLEQRCRAKNDKTTTTRFKPFYTNRVHARSEVVLVLSAAVLSEAVLVLE